MFEEMVGRRVYIILKSGRKYTAFVDDVEGSLLKIRDKYGKIVYISSNEISIIQEENG